MRIPHNDKAAGNRSHDHSACDGSHNVLLFVLAPAYNLIRASSPYDLRNHTRSRRC